MQEELIEGFLLVLIHVPMEDKLALAAEEEEELQELIELAELVTIAPVKSGQPGQEDNKPMVDMDRKPSLVVCRWAENRCCCGCSS